MEKKTAEFLYKEKLNPLPKGECCAVDISAAAERLCKQQGGTLYFKEGVYTLKSSVTVPENVDLCFAEGAILETEGDAVFTYLGKNITAGKYRIFAENCNLAGFEKTLFGRPEWFGAAADGKTDCSKAFSRAVKTFNTVYLSKGKYLVTETVYANAHSSLVIEGEGMDKTFIIVANGITGFWFNPIHDKNKSPYNAVTVKNLAMREIKRRQRSVAINYQGGDLRIDGCAFYGFKCGFETSYSGWTHFTNSYTEGNKMACQIKEHSMFLYYKFCHSKNDGNFLFCEIPPSGGYSNGIDINGVLIEDAKDTAIYCCENQALFIDDCHIKNCHGAHGIYCGKDFDVSVSNCEIEAAEDNDGFVGIYSSEAHSQYYSNNYIKNAKTGIVLEGPYNWRNMSAIDRNVFVNCKENYFKIHRANDYKIFNNIYDGSLPESAEISEINGVNGIYRNNKVGNTAGYFLKSLYGHTVATEKDAVAYSHEQSERYAPFMKNKLFEQASCLPHSYLLADESNYMKLLSDKTKRARCIRFKKGCYNIEKSLTVAEKTVLWLERGAVISVADGARLNIKSNRIIAGQYKIFDGKNIVIKNAPVVFAEWFGENEEGKDFSITLQRAVNAARGVVLPKGDIILQNTVKLPSGKYLTVSGQAIKQTFIKAPESGLIFDYRENKEGGVLFADFYVIGKENCSGADFLRFKGTGEKNRIATYNLVFEKIGKVFKVDGCNNFYAYLTRNINIKHYFDFKNCKNILLDSLLDPPGCGEFVTAESCEKVVLYNIASVGAHAVDVSMKNCKNITVKQGGLDLGCYRNKEELKTSYAAGEFINCENVLFEGHWIATNITPSCYPKGNAESEERDNLVFIGCKNVTVAGNSTVNCKRGVTVSKCKNVTVVGNKGEANMLYDFSVNDSENVDLEYNFCLSNAWRGTKREIFAGRGMKNSRIRYNSLGTAPYKLSLEYAIGDNEVSHNGFKVVSGDPEQMSEAIWPK
ncbi:MAG: hypothetical protein IKA51_05225 [Clostridia bacterium]|nr:hypothetical protein [Clostridia bacterium]